MRSEVNPKDLDDAIRYYTRFQKLPLEKSNLVLHCIEPEDPKELLKDIYPLNQERGWLAASYEKEEWIKGLENVEIRRFKRIINNFLDGNLMPVIQINGKLCDGFGRCIFYHAIGKNILTHSLINCLTASSSFISTFGYIKRIYLSHSRIPPNTSLCIMALNGIPSS